MFVLHYLLTAPTRAVAGATASRVDGTSMLVSWTELTLREARGFPVYTVLYEPSTRPVEMDSQQAASVSGVMNPPVTVGGTGPCLRVRGASQGGHERNSCKWRWTRQ